MEEVLPSPDEAMPERRRSRWRVVAIAVAVALALVVALYGWIGSDDGRRYAASRINGLSFENGLTIRVQKIEGSLFGKLRLKGLTLSDPQGVFLKAAVVDVQWRPFQLARNHLVIRSLQVPGADWVRFPHLKPGPPNKPLLPNMDIDIDRLTLRNLRVAPGVAGPAHVLALNGKAHIADRRAQITARAVSLTGQGRVGDRLDLVLDAVPDRNRLALDARLASANDGFVPGLMGVRQPLVLAVKGKGDWARWRGRLSAMAGGKPMADLALGANDGRFAVQGPVWTQVALPGSRTSLLAPVTRLDLKASAQQRRLTLSGGAGNDRFRMRLAGTVDLGANEMKDLAVAFTLARAGPIATGMAGDGVAARLLLNGTFAQPRLDYGLDARRLSLGGTGLERLAVSGHAALGKDHWQIPFAGRVGHVTGVNPSIAPLLDDLRVSGDFAYANGRLLSDNVKLVSSRMNATAVVVADLDKALYTGGLQGRIDNYRVESVGIFNLRTHIDLKSGGRDYFRLAGRITARSTRLLSDGLRGFLGGNALIVADVGYDSNGLATLDRLTVTAPAFQLGEGKGWYRPDGTIGFAGRGRSTRYGPLGLALAGRADRPVARITATRPGLGIGLADVTATITGQNGGYRVEARGQSDYGPVDAHLLARGGAGGLRLEVQPGTRLSGVGLTGTLSQPGGGPFLGTLAARGSGIIGTVRLASLSGHQRIVAHASADHATLPGRVGLAVDRALLDADIVLLERPRVAADVQLAGARIGNLYLAGARGRVRYQGGAGTAQLLAEGRTHYPFRMAVNAALQPQLWRVAIKGRFNGIDVASQGPLRITPTRQGYVLAPSAIKAGDGFIRLAGRYGPGLAMEARMEKVDLALANPFVPGLGLGGTATGSLDFSQAGPSAFPAADARLQIAGFTRTSLAATSVPVDIQLVGRLVPDGGTASAIVRRRGHAIGRMQVALRPLSPAAGSWTTRLLAAPLAGGVRYNGPADTLFSLAALSDQSLKGAIGVAADFTGRVNAPHLTGLVRANNLTYENGQYGTRLTHMQLRGSFTDDKLQVESLTARAGDGTISGQGFVSLSSQEGFPAQLGLDMKRARLASGSNLATVATGRIDVVNAPGQTPTITGTLSLPETHYRIVRQGSARIATLTGVRRKPALGRRRISGDPEAMQGLPADWKLDIDIRADNKVFVTGMGLNSEWGAKLHAGGTARAPVLSGSVSLVRGNLSFAGRSFELTEGRLRFTGDGMVPEMYVVATGDVEDVATTITISGSSANPQIAFTSTPSLPRDELMARILFGNSVGELTAIQAVQLAASLNSLRASKGGLNPLGVLQSSTGIDRLRILGADKTTGRETSLAVGKYISNDIYVEIVTDARGYTAAQIEVSLSRALSVLSEMGSFGSSSVGLRYRKDY